MSTSLRRRAALVLTSLLLATAAVFGTAGTASADPVIPLHWKVDASTTLKSLGLTVDVTGGTFDGELDLGTGDLSGQMNLPPATKDISLGWIRLASTTFAMNPAGPIEGKVNLQTLEVSVKASFNIQLAQLKVLRFPYNLVGTRCTTVTPITVEMGGVVDLTSGSGFTGEYTIPKFKDCGLLTPIMNLIIPSSGNTFTATFAPA